MFATYFYLVSSPHFLNTTTITHHDSGPRSRRINPLRRHLPPPSNIPGHQNHDHWALLLTSPDHATSTLYTIDESPPTSTSPSNSNSHSECNSHFPLTTPFPTPNPPFRVEDHLESILLTTFSRTQLARFRSVLRAAASEVKLHRRGDTGWERKWTCQDYVPHVIKELEVNGVVDDDGQDERYGDGVGLFGGGLWAEGLIFFLISGIFGWLRPLDWMDRFWFLERWLGLGWLVYY